MEDEGKHPIDLSRPWEDDPKEVARLDAHFARLRKDREMACNCNCGCENCKCGS